MERERALEQRERELELSQRRDQDSIDFEYRLHSKSKLDPGVPAPVGAVVLENNDGVEGDNANYGDYGECSFSGVGFNDAAATPEVQDRT